VDEQLIARLAGKAREGGLQLTGEGGLLAQLTKRLVESALEGELTDHLGYDRHDAAGRDGGNSRNGHRSKTVLTEVGPVEIEVPRDHDGSFEPKIVAKRQRRLSGIDELVISLSAKGLTTGEVQAHLAEVYGAQVSRQTISTITDKVVEGMAEWQNRPPADPATPARRHRRQGRHRWRGGRAPARRQPLLPRSRAAAGSPRRPMQRPTVGGRIESSRRWSCASAVRPRRQLVSNRAGTTRPSAS
jgi:Transposase, Mutator family